MKQLKVSAVVGIAVTVLAVVTAFAFSFATISYQREVVKLRKVNEEYRQTIDDYKAALDGIRRNLATIEVGGRR